MILSQKLTKGATTLNSQVMPIKKLSLNDFHAVKQMNTGIDDDYVIRIFDRLISSRTQELFGLFHEGELVSIGGYSLFGNNQYAMIGRLRSNLKLRSKGYSTALLTQLIKELRQKPDVKWIGANTHVSNDPTRRVLEKIGMQPGLVSHYLTLTAPEKLNGYTPGAVWKEVFNTREKLSYLLNLSDNALGLFPYECYYPLPYDQVFFTENYLEEACMYVNPDKTRFVLIKNDQKKYRYAHVKYFWNDHYQQPGFFETILDHWNKNDDNYGSWIDFSVEGFKQIADVSPYEVQDPWILYDVWT
ncbi:GNAT family N-acetyltransferase [Halobacillus naozhouensis]|uniref:GNAT family N-acetyltransferase n=1 Tax=Halobacillus naozhouensis TaxID=554880 RepID=A0ABY8IV62_9BACI|nr:GNAT family N-acetyltransferase [Halobacillus naozhouensis]WFT73702.1 GNAT family N-acetyltransferase [Halobacillus naozhouensis]